MSKDKKTVFKWFTIFQYEKEQEYLGKMHAKGWKLKRVSGLGFYHFVKCEPELIIRKSICKCLRIVVGNICLIMRAIVIFVNQCLICRARKKFFVMMNQDLI